MKRFSFIIFLWVTFLSLASAQHLSRHYHNRSMSDVLIDLDKASARYKVSFIYNELEDFTVTQDVEAPNIPDAIRRVIGFYPMKMVVSDSLITVECIRKSERKLIGRLIDNHNLPVEFANVQLLNPHDSTFLCGGVSNANGDFVIPCEPNQAIMKVSYVGYKTISRLVNVGRIGTIRMQADAYQLKRVMVKGNLRTDRGDHATYTFNEEQVKNSRHTQDLIANIPGIIIDPVTGKTRSIVNKKMKILINDVAMTSDNDLKSIPAEKIKKVEYYDAPPARYGDVDILVNIITKPLDTGYAVGFDAKTAFTTGFVNGNTYYKYNKGYSQFFFDYNIEMRNYHDCIGEDHYSFMIDDRLADYLYSYKKHFGYTNNTMNLKYAYSKPEDITFQVTATPNYLHTFYRGNVDILAQNHPEWTNGKGHNDNYTNTFGPSLDLYLSKQLPHKQQIDVDVLGTYYHNDQQDLNQQWKVGDDAQADAAPMQKEMSVTDADDNILVDDKMRSKNNSYSLITEVNYSKQWKKGELTLGWNNWLKWSDYTIRNVLSGYEPYNSSSRINIQTFSAEYQNNLGKLNYRIGAEGVWREQKNDDTRKINSYIRPTFLLTYPLKKGSIQLQTLNGVNYPPIANLNENTTIIIPGVVNQGNPNLTSNNEYGTFLRINHYASWIQGQLAFFGVYTDSPMSVYYEWRTIQGEKYLVQTYENSHYQWWYGMGYAINIKPFKNELLNIGLYGSFERYSMSSGIIGKHNQWRIPLTYQIDVRKGKWGASYIGHVVAKEPRGPYNYWDESASNLSVYYQLGNWRITATGYWLFNDAKYRFETIDNPILSRKEWHTIRDNNRMVSIGVSWNFFSGKKKDIQKNINNRDADSGAFK